LDYIANSNKNTPINANKAIALISANLKIAILNNSSFKKGFREIFKINAPNTVSIPTSAPARLYMIKLLLIQY
jgi:hypothetical protein